MARASIRHIALGLAAGTLLMGCVEGGGPFGAAKTDSADTGTAAAIRPSRSGDRDVEAPEVFQTTDTALWDGRPSLGGVWVASPETQDPERVIMRNTANGKSVVGALFRRERENPGPKLQISSDAAEALGLLAGQPGEISVVALRRAEEEAPSEAVAAAETAAETAAEPAAETTTAAAAETAAAEPAEGETAAPETAAVAAAALDAVDGAAATPAVPDAAAAEAALTPKEKRQLRRQKRLEERAAAKAAREAAAAGTAMPLDAMTPGAADAVPAEALATEAISSAPLDDAPLDAAPAASPATTGGRPIQIATLSAEANATRAVDALAKAGIPATINKGDRDGKAFWSVTATGDADLLAKIKAAGFADAFFLK